MKWMLSAAMLGLLAAGCGDGSQQAKPAGTSDNSSGNPITAPVDYVGAVGKAKRTGEKVADIATLQKAIQAFHAEEDRYPKDLNELVTTKILPRLPEPPYGMKFQYNPATGQIKAVSAQ